MKVIIIPLMLLMFSSILGLARVMGYVDFTGEPMPDTYIYRAGTSYDVNGSLIVNSTKTQITTDTAQVGIGNVITSGVLGLVLSALALVAVSGFNVVGSGLNDVAVQAIFKCACYFGVWTLFSCTALLLFQEVPVFGVPFYFLLTLFYSVGVVGEIG